MEIQDMIDLVANVLAIALLVVKAYQAAKPWMARQTETLWKRTRQATTADVAAARSAPVWLKAVAGFLLVYGVGAVLTYGALYDAAPLWAMCWFGSVWLSLWGYAGWLAVRWAVRQTRRMIATPA